MSVSHSNYLDYIGFYALGQFPRGENIKLKEAPEPVFTKEGQITPGGIGSNI